MRTLYVECNMGAAGDMLNAALDKEAAVSYTVHLKKTLPVAMEMAQTYTMYTNKACLLYTSRCV